MIGEPNYRVILLKDLLLCHHFDDRIIINLMTRTFPHLNDCISMKSFPDLRQHATQNNNF